ncbi:c-type cytochrome [Cyanobium sp. HWJ4-Hawea]|uniref:c-type cytochrome n=1 Tax=Cyanobium sp. HWJ4-Hawea TaxID=2823713 RepID=UPI0020CBF80B|nr:c-type cytochrome [Cyanobium sp. HWJ4-Hawea]
MPTQFRDFFLALGAVLVMAGLFAPGAALADLALADLGLADVSAGEALFQNHCVGCHVNGGNILRRGKTLKLAALERNGITSADAVALIAANGLGQMSGYGAVLGDGGAEQVASYVWSRAQAGWP